MCACASHARTHAHTHTPHPFLISFNLAQDSMKKVKEEVEAEKSRIAALVGESSASLPEVADMMSEKGKAGGPVKPAYKSAIVQPKPFTNPDRTPPPRSFEMCVEQAYLSAKAAIDAGYKLLEVHEPSSASFTRFL